MKKPCPNEEMLSEYLETRLSDKEKAEIESHLSDCSDCLENFAVASRVVRGGDQPDLDPVPDRVTDAAIRALKERHAVQPAAPKKKSQKSFKDLCSMVLKSLTPEPWAKPEFAPIRSSKKIVSADLIHIKKTFKQIDTEIEIEKIAGRKAHIRVKLPEDNGKDKDVRVTLKRNSRQIASHLLNQDYVLFEGIPFGRYSLTFTRGRTILGEYFFEIKESSNG